MAKHINIKIYGRVQGVSFRYYTVKEAKKLKLSGLVKNEPDGSVYIEAEGEEKDLNKLLIWCEQGSSWAKVEKVEHEYSSELKKYSDFIIEY